MFNIAALAARPSSANATRPASANSRGRSRAPLSSVNSNLAGAPRTPRDVVPQKGAIGGGRAASTKRKRSRRRQKNEIYTPLVPHSAARGQRSTNGAARATHTLSLQPSKPSIEAPASAETPEAAVADRAAADATAAGKKEATASPYASIPAAHLGSAELALVLNFGHRSNVVGKVRSLPFRLEPPPPSADADARIPVAFERIPFAAGFDVVVGGHDAVKQEFVACNGKSLVDRNAPTVIHLRREEEEEAKVFHVLWAPKREGEVRDEIHITSPWGRHRIAVLGIARGSATFARPAKSVGRSNGADRFYGRDNITYDAQSWEEAQCATFRTWLNDLFHPNGEDKPVSEGQLAAEWKAARTLFESPRMRAVRCTVEREVREGRLSMTAKSGRHILDEVLVQDQLTKLLLSYSPRWLQLGLGIVLSMDDDASFQKLMMAKPMTKESLKKIIMQRVLTDPSAVRKYDRGRCNESKLQAIVHQRALSQSMILAFFLDKAKLQRVLVDDPCLFEPSSSLKSSDDVLVSLCQDCFSKQGSIIRHLAYDGVSVSHVQKPLDEYDFYVRNLAVDLKDGVCLAKLIDIVTGSSNLLSAMRLPAATRQFRAHNVNLALAALRQLGVPRISDITTAHIIDAHQPRVIQLLWSSVLHFDLPEFRQEIVQYNAARSIQSHSRRFLALKSYRVARQGTVMFQSLYRGFLIRAFVRRVTSAATDLQRIWRGYRAKLSYGLDLMDIVAAQSVCRRFLARRHVAEMARSMNSASTAIQRIWRGFSAKVGYGCALIDIITVQCVARRFVARHRVARMKAMTDASTSIQRVWRGYSAKLAFGCDLIDIITVQSIGRRLLAQKALVKRHCCAATIQSTVRKSMAMKRYRNTKRSAGIVQGLMRKTLAQIRVRDRKERVILLQRVYRGWLRRKQSRLTSTEHAAELPEPPSNSLSAQSPPSSDTPIASCPETPDDAEEICFTTYHAPMHRNSGELALIADGEEQDEAVIELLPIKDESVAHSSPAPEAALQEDDSVEISYSTRHAPSAIGVADEEKPAVLGIETNIIDELEEEEASILIQTAWRCHVASKSYATKRSSALALQPLLRRFLAERNMQSRAREAATTPSAAAYRGHAARAFASVAAIQNELIQECNDFEHAQAEPWIIALQFHARRWLASRNEAATQIQKIFRGFAAFDHFFVARFAASIIQSAYRRHAVARSYRSLWRSMAVVQAHCRGKIARRQVVSKHEAACVLQRAGRRLLDKLERRRTILESAASMQKTQSLAAITLQRAWRGCKANVDFMLLVLATIKIQTFARRRSAEARYLQARNAVVEVQTMVRGRMTRQGIAVQHESAKAIQAAGRRLLARMKRQRIMGAVATLQRAGRAMVTRMRNEVTSFAATEIQRIYRGFRCNADLALSVVASVKIQAAVRGRQARLVAATRRWAVSTLQRAARLMVAGMRGEVECFASTEIQRVWRGYQANVDYMLLVLSAIKVQAAARSLVARRHFALRRESACVLQRAGRSFLAKLEGRRVVAAQAAVARMRKRKAERSAAVSIQRIWRGYRANVDFMLVVVSAITVQAFARRISAEARAREMQEERLMAEAEKEQMLREQVLRERIEVEEALRASPATAHSSWDSVASEFGQHRSIGGSALSHSLARSGAGDKLLESRDDSPSQVGQSSPYSTTPSPRVDDVPRRGKTILKSPDEFPACEVIIHVEPSKFARHTAKAVRTLQKSKKFSEVMKAAMNLQMITQDSIEDCKVIAEGNIQRKMFAIIRSCNRSSPHLELIRVLLSVMTNLAEHPSTLPLVANETAINALTDMVQLYRDKSAIFALSSSLLERMLWSSNRLMSDYSTPENKKRLRGILLLCKTKASELDDARKGMRSLENVLRHL